MSLQVNGAIDTSCLLPCTCPPCSVSGNVQYPSFRCTLGYGGCSSQGSWQSHRNIQLHHHQDRQSDEDGQDGASCEPGGVSSLLPAAEIEGVLPEQRSAHVHVCDDVVIITSLLHDIVHVYTDLKKYHKCSFARPLLQVHGHMA